MKTQEQKENDQKIKDAYKLIRHKQSFTTYLSVYIGQTFNTVKQNYFYGQGTPVELQQIVLDKINLQLKYDKIIEEKIWNIK